MKIWSFAALILCAERATGLLHKAYVPLPDSSVDSNASLVLVSNFNTWASKNLQSDADQVNECYEKETARLKKQVVEATIVKGGAIAAKAAGTIAGGAAKSIPFVGQVAGATVEAVAHAAADTAVLATETAHAIQNLDADNCEQMAARKTLEALESLEANHQETMKGLEDLEANQQEATKKVMQGLKDMQTQLGDGQKKTNELIRSSSAAAQKQVQEMESQMSASFAKAAQVASVLNAKLDRLLSKAQETLDYIRLSNYHEFAASFTSAVCAMSGAYNDMTAALDKMEKHKQSLNLTDGRHGVKQWLHNERELRLMTLSSLQDIWARYRDNFEKALAIIVEGDFLMLHYSILLQDEAERLLQKSKKDTKTNFDSGKKREKASRAGAAHEVFSGDILENLAKKLNHDETIAMLQVDIIRMSTMAGIMEKLFPSGEVRETMIRAISSYHSYLLDIKERLESKAFVHEILQPTLLANFGMDGACAVAAHEQGYINALDDWVLWDTLEAGEKIQTHWKIDPSHIQSWKGRTPEPEPKWPKYSSWHEWHKLFQSGDPPSEGARVKAYVSRPGSALGNHSNAFFLCLGLKGASPNTFDRVISPVESKDVGASWGKDTTGNFFLDPRPQHEVNPADGSSQYEVKRHLERKESGFFDRPYGLMSGVHEKNIMALPASTIEAVIKGVAAMKKGLEAAPPEAPEALTCTFETGKCLYMEVGQKNWTRTNKGTTSSNTGPNKPKEGAWYIYTEASWNFNKDFILESPIFAVTKASKLQFHYHMRGTTMGSLTVSYQVTGSTAWNQLFKEDRNLGTDWKEARLELPGNAARLRFAAKTGTSYQSDIALDDITVVDK